MKETTIGTVVLGFGPQSIDWINKAAKLCGKDAVMDPDVARMAGANLCAGNPEALALLRKRLEAGALESQKASTPGLSEAAQKWLAHGERGTSSNAIFSHLTGIDATGFGGFDHPHDPADFRRCRLLLEQVPGLKERISEMRSVSPAWACLVDQWDSICATMDKENPYWPQGGGSCPETSSLIRAAIGR